MEKFNDGRMIMETTYVKNMTKTNQQFRAGGHKFLLHPDETVAMTKEEINDHVVQLLLARGVLAVLDDENGLRNIVEQVQKRQEKANEGKLEVNNAGADTTKQVILVQCAANKKNGERCLNNVSVPIAEYHEATPYFCGTHKNADASLYKLVDGAWVVEQPVAPEAAGDESAVSELDLDDIDL